MVESKSGGSFNEINAHSEKSVEFSVPDDCQRVEWRGKPDQPPLFMHQYCFLKTHKRDYAEWLYGADVFAGDTWRR
jgi:hypothetical protein